MEERQDHATRTISIVMIIALVGKVLGLYRDHLLAVYYGTGMAANAFNTASRIPRVFLMRCSPPLSRPALSRCSASISPGRGGSRPSASRAASSP